MSLTEVFPTISKLTRQQKMRLILRLAKELGLKDDVFVAQPKRIYYVYSPYDAYGAGRALMEAKKLLQKKKV